MLWWLVLGLTGLRQHMRHGRGIGARRRGGSSQVEADDLLVGYHSGRARLYWSDCRHGKVVRGAMRMTCAGKCVRDERWRVYTTFATPVQRYNQLSSVSLSRWGEDCRGAFAIRSVEEDATEWVLNAMEMT
jgi:hypothetical protein